VTELFPPMPYGRNLGFRDHVRQGLVGEGLDLGPWHEPFFSPNGNTKTVERYSLRDLKVNFADLPVEELAKLQEPDFVCDFDKDFLAEFDDDSYDFIVASHLLEHVAQPFLLVSDIYRVLKNDGILLIALPDLRNTFDNRRIPMDFEHFKKDIKLQIKIDEISHVIDYMSNVLSINPEKMSSQETQKVITESYHVHAFTDRQFVFLLNEMQEFLNFHFELIDASQSMEADARYEEFILVLKKTDSSTDIQSAFFNLTSRKDKNFGTFAIKLKKFLKRF
jgi:SAM-dependent methyltransferase